MSDVEVAVAPEAELDKWFDLPYVADMFSVTTETVRVWINTKQLPASKLGGRYWRVKRSDLIAFANVKHGS